MIGRRRLGGEWETTRLGALATFRKGKGIRRSDLRKIGARCVRYGELYTRYRNYVVDPVSRIPEDIAATALRIEKGELLFAGSGETAEEIGTCVAYIGEEPAYVGGDIIVLRAPRQDPVYLAHLLNAPEAARQKARMAQGDAVVHIRGDHLAEVEVPLPPLPEQRAIAAVLMDVDALIGSLEALIAKKRAIKRAAMQQLLTGRTRLPGFEGEWEARRLGGLARIATGTRNNQDKCHDGRYPFFVRSSSVERIDSFAYDCEAILIPGEGRIGEIFHYVHGRFDVHQRVYAISDFRSCVFVRFLYYYIAEHFGAHALKNTVKATVDSLRRPTFLAFRVPLPPLSEQRAIAAVLTDMDDEIAALERRLDKTRSIKQGMMRQLLTGTIRLPIPDAVAEEPGR
ncbi:MAG: restriction endonuclease subunit S [Gammaproteobacteria bacterium]|nr:restriction endonuclease subunit S [Gammaproteobacteria bacterium]